MQLFANIVVPTCGKSQGLAYSYYCDEMCIYKGTTCINPFTAADLCTAAL